MKKFTSYFLFIFISIISFIIFESCDESDPWKPNGLYVGMYHQGGTIISLDEERKSGVIAAKVNQSDSTSWHNASTICDTLTLNGYNNWRLPTEEESYHMYRKRAEISCHDPAWFWTSTINSTGDSIIIRNFTVNTGDVLYLHKDSTRYLTEKDISYPIHLRAVRDF